VTVATQGPPHGWIAVEHRFLGLDRRTFGPGLTALGVALALVYGLSALDAAIPWHNETRAGDVLDLGAGAVAVPPVGWQLQSGALVGGAAQNARNLRVLLATGGATIELRGTSYDGSSAAFLAQVRRSEGDDPPGADGSIGTLTTDSGLVGVAQGSTGPGGDGLDVAFKMASGAGLASAPALLVRVRAAPGQFERRQDEVLAFLRSIGTR
jgi:hypothetical protein